jgi:anti-anti-sigma regulatory factor
VKDIPEYAFSLSDAEIRKRGAATLEAFLRALDGEPPTAYGEFWRHLSYLRFTSGVPMDAIQPVLLGCNATIRDCLREALSGDLPTQIEAADACTAIAQSGVLALYVAYEQAKDELILAQQASLRQLSTPIIPVHAGVLVAPLIGAIDAEKASDMLDRLLDGISRARAAVVIIDLTGVPVVDATVAQHLLRASRAAALLGATVVFVGISPATARGLTALGVELEGLKTLANLQLGIEYALRRQGLAIGPLARAPGRAAASAR